jgi:hypothetical protein
MKRKRFAVAKNDFFYAFVMFAMFAVMVFHVAVEFFGHQREVYFARAGEAMQPRAARAEVDARAVQAVRAA